MARNTLNRHRRKGAIHARIAAALSGLVLVAGCSSAPPANDSSGKDRPTVVSLNPCIDAILVEIAPPDQVLALSHYSRDPGSSSIQAGIAERYGVTGGTAEEVIAVQPDLVLASTFLPQPTRAALERAGLKVVTFGSPTTTSASIAQVRQVAAITGRLQEGEDLVRDIAQAAQTMPDQRPVSALLWQPGEIVPGDATLVAEMLRLKGFTNHAAAMGLSQADFVPLETVLANPPELLLVAGESAGQRHPLLAGLTGTRVEPLEPRLLYCGGRTIAGLAMRLDQIRADLLP